MDTSAEKEVKVALNEVKNDNAPGPTGTTTELRRGARKGEVRELTELVSNIVRRWEKRESTGREALPYLFVKGKEKHCSVEIIEE